MPTVQVQSSSSQQQQQQKHQEAPPLAGESVYNLIPASHSKKEAHRMYKSKYAASAAVPPSCSTFGFSGTSKVCGNVAGNAANVDPESHPAIKPVGGMGRSVANEVDPKNFLKRTTATTVKVAGNPGAGGAAGGCRVKETSTKKAYGASYSGPSSSSSSAQHSPSSQSGAEQQQQQGGEGGGGEGEHQHHQHEGQEYQCHRIHEKCRPNVPGRSEKPVMNLTSGKNFVAENAKEIAGAHPRPQPLEQRAVDLQDFARVPDYLKKIKAGIQQEKSLAKSRAVAVATAVDYDELTNGEVIDLRQGLQRRYDELSRAIKSLPFKLETRSQIRRKEVLEQDLAAVEVAQAKLARKRILILK